MPALNIFSLDQLTQEQHKICVNQVKVHHKDQPQEKLVFLRLDILSRVKFANLSLRQNQQPIIFEVYFLQESCTYDEDSLVKIPPV